MRIMDSRFYLQKAQEAEAIANASMTEVGRREWDTIANEYRLLAHEAAKLRAISKTPADHPEK